MALAPGRAGESLRSGGRGVNEQVWWYLARATGIVTLVLLVAGLVLGVLLSTRAMKPHDRPAWLLAMHRWLSSLVIAGTAIHVVALVADSYAQFGLVEILIPMTSAWRPVAVTFGVAAMYLLVAIHVSSVLMKRLPKAAWRRIHALSALLVWSAVIHGALAGTDATNPVYQALAWLFVSVAVSAGIIRVVVGRNAKADRNPRRAAATDVASDHAT